MAAPSMSARPRNAALAVAALALTPSVVAAQSGLLLGLETGNEYRTLWIAAEGDSVALLASGPGLLVPRADGFWRVGVIALDDQAEIAVAAPASRWAAVTDSLRRSYQPPTSDRCDTIYQHEVIQFLGANYLSTRAWGGMEGCAWGGRGAGTNTRSRHSTRPSPRRENRWTRSRSDG